MPTGPDDTALVMPHVGWSNAVPGAGTHVSLDVRGTRLEFDGFGYHDKNWGDIPFAEAVQSWYWGHAQLGPYTLVWFDALATAKNGGEMKPEYRLPPLIPGSILIPMGLFWYGWSVDKHLHWIMGIVGTLWVGFGMLGKSFLELTYRKVGNITNAMV